MSASASTSDKIPLDPEPPAPEYTQPGLKFRRLAKVFRLFRKSELKRGYDIKVAYKDDENGVVMVCVAAHKKCPWQVATELVPATESDEAYYRIRHQPFCVIHNHAPIYPFDSSPPKDAPDSWMPPSSSYIPPQPFTDFLYSISSSMAVYASRFADLGMGPDFRPDSLEDLSEEEITRDVVKDVEMTVVEQKAFVWALKKGSEKRKNDLRAAGLTEEESLDTREWFMDAELVDEKANVLEKTQDERLKIAEEQGLANQPQAAAA
ncbi:hypothetical protein MNV49_007312 [Pseudohyphozyma bogoriensis]|nr:hypothetical protein MNV49_007312 [Pseudohyphozyma bogoriensis]